MEVWNAPKAMSWFLEVLSVLIEAMMPLLSRHCEGWDRIVRKQPEAICWNKVSC
jgi:hypothetical protein